ncbi:hypothetical protein EYF80_051600 [Liparis tanakae]|uniref:Uncharacterized protein n=1 Tax=Liparis tanakae TaxID=230148 RepID=A0A4Z2FBT1_9TELE|nr:hypothetical protein EYF80_051600 [Liparis tanakae]
MAGKGGRLVQGHGSGLDTWYDTEVEDAFAKMEGSLQETENQHKPIMDLTVPSDRMEEPTREGVTMVVLGLRRGCVGDDTLDPSRVFWPFNVEDFILLTFSRLG